MVAAPGWIAPEGSASVYAATVRQARKLGLQVVELSEERDVDGFDDLLALWRGRGG